MDLRDELQASLGEGYAIERELGGGGMSRVFLATETALGRRVVIKVLPPEMAAGLSIERFRREIQLAASLQHPHVVPLLTAGRAEGSGAHPIRGAELLYYTMPFVEGESLRARLAREGELPVPVATRILKDVAEALSYAHQHGVVHRDIKPDNIMLTGGHAVVTDFGVGKALSASTGETSLTSLGVALGTPSYMAPEQASADPNVDHRADIYALGVVGYELLTGQPPFTGTLPQQVLAAHVTQAPEQVTSRRPACPPQLATLVMRCLEKRPADRWQTAAELEQQLTLMTTPSGGTAPTSAMPAASGAMPGRHSPRLLDRRVWIPVALVLLLGLVGGVFALGRGSRGGGAAAAPTDRIMLAVLPFTNLGEAGDEYFADGVTDEIRGKLTGLGNLGVISRESANQYKNTPKSLSQIGQELGVRYVLEGTIRWEKEADGASRVLVSPELVRVSDGTNVWAGRFQAQLADIFQVQGEIAQQVANGLGLALGGTAQASLAARPTSNLQAYDSYLRGLEFVARGYDPENQRGAEESFRKAVALDSSFADAWAALARIDAQIYWFNLDRSSARLAQAKDAIDRSLALAPNSPSGYVARGLYHYWGFRDYARALDDFQQALQLQPDNLDAIAGTGWVMRRLGRWEEAIVQLKRTAELDPRSLDDAVELGQTYLVPGHYQEAEQAAARGTIIAPEQIDGWIWQAMTRLARTGDLAQARSLVAAAPAVAWTRWPSSILDLDYQETQMQLMAPEDLAVILANPINANDADSGAYYLFRAEGYRLLGKTEVARSYADSAVSRLGFLVRQEPDNAWNQAGLAAARAEQKDWNSALRHAQRAVDLLPVSLDALSGPQMLDLQAQLLCRAGRAGEAVPIVRRLLRIPSHLSPGILKTMPVWAPLRALPEYQELLQVKKSD